MTAADQAGVGGRVVRGAKRAAGNQRPLGAEQAGNAVDLRGLNRLIPGSCPAKWRETTSVCQWQQLTATRQWQEEVMG
jgi:hypothetical protein